MALVASLPPFSLLATCLQHHLLFVPHSHEGPNHRLLKGAGPTTRTPSPKTNNSGDLSVTFCFNVWICLGVEFVCMVAFASVGCCFLDLVSLPLWVLLLLSLLELLWFGLLLSVSLYPWFGLGWVVSGWALFGLYITK